MRNLTSTADRRQSLKIYKCAIFTKVLGRSFNLDPFTTFFVHPNSLHRHMGQYLMVHRSLIR